MEAEFKPQANPQSSQQGLVHIGADVKVTGKFEACDIAEIHGSLDGEIQTNELIIHEGGHLTGMAVCKVVRISGALDGEVDASELLQIQAKGRVDGKINYTRLVIEDGGILKGDVSPNSKIQGSKPEVPLKNSPGDTLLKITDQSVVSVDDLAAE